MCTLIVAHHLFAREPLVVAANRDEMLARPASGPRIMEGATRVLMPRDEVAGGSWLGLNEHGLFVGITNRAGVSVDASRRSRGLLVAEALQARDARSLHRQLAELRVAEFNSFHLLYADSEAAFVTWSDGQKLTQAALEPGLHVVTERSLGADDRGRADRLQKLFSERIVGHVPTIGLLWELLVLHGPPEEPLAGSCIHADAFGYGTRSSFIYVAGEPASAAWIEGHPCQAPLEDLSALVSGLLARS
jgi:hypothetical protein